MGYSDEELNDVFDKKVRKKQGHCIYCGVTIYFANYGGECAKGAWEVDHSKSLARGGTDHPNNRVPACFICNRVKSDMNARSFRNYVEQNWGRRKRGWQRFRRAMRRRYCGD